jgi:putative transposase
VSAEVRAGLRSTHQAQEAEPPRHLASRRSRGNDLCQKHWLWRAIDQDGYILDEIVQTRRNTKAAKRLLRRLLRK